MVESSCATEEHVAMVAMIGQGRGGGRQVRSGRGVSWCVREGGTWDEHRTTAFHDFGTKFELDRIFSFFFNI
jgi:hypothetical protein